MTEELAFSFGPAPPYEPAQDEAASAHGEVTPPQVPPDAGGSSRAAVELALIHRLPPEKASGDVLADQMDARVNRALDRALLAEIGQVAAESREKTVASYCRSFARIYAVVASMIFSTALTVEPSVTVHSLTTKAGISCAGAGALAVVGFGTRFANGRLRRTRPKGRHRR